MVPFSWKIPGTSVGRCLVVDVAVNSDDVATSEEVLFVVAAELEVVTGGGDEVEVDD